MIFDNEDGKAEKAEKIAIAEVDDIRKYTDRIVATVSKYGKA